ncbi:MAG TPA: hypothetical protein VLB82_04940 [Thermodesulfobacteriota bacterium]|nr:hypothetical protein [Thermodesulfobacteriota bacterium]
MNKYIFLETDGYYFTDDTEDLIGPFDTIELAETAMNHYNKWAIEDHRQELRKMRDYYD